MPKKRWFPALRALLTIGRHLGRIADALEKQAGITDAAYRGVTPAGTPLPDPEPEPLEIAYNSDLDFARAHDVEQRLMKQLGRVPTPEEVCLELDGLEYDAQDPRVVVGRRQPERERLH